MRPAQQAAAPAARSLEPGAGERIWITGDTVCLKATAAETGGAYTMLEVLSAPGNGPPPHVHENEDETFLVLDGEFELFIDRRLVRLAAGAYALVPRRTAHRWRCVGERPGRMLIVFTPGGIEGFFREAGRPATGQEPAPPVDADEIARTEAAGARYGLRVVAWAT